MATTPRTISERLSQAAVRGFVGRERELGILCSRGRWERPLVTFVHGPGGIGKSRLLRMALALLEDEARTIAIDCREVEPTPDGFMRAIAGGLGSGDGEHDAETMVRLLGDDARRVVIALDTYERFGLLDTWLRQVFLPSLPDTVETIIAGREGPSPGWLTSPGWAGLVGRLHLSPLDQAESISMLLQLGLSELQAARINRFAGGYPLALELAADALRAEPDLRIELGPPPRVIEQLLDAVVAGLPAATLETLEAASTARRVTEPILRSLLARPSVRHEFEDLRRLPFVERTPQGLVIHDVVRDVVAADLSERDPEAHARYRRRAWSYFEARARSRVRERLWEVTADLIYLIQNPVLRAACFPVGAGEDAVEPALAADGTAIREIADVHDGGAAPLVGRWWELHPATFSVARTPRGGVAALLQLTQFDRIDPAIFDLDPVARAWSDHLASVPPRDGDRVLAMRRWLGRETGEMLSPAVGACWLDVKRVYMELRPHLSRLYSVIADPAALAPIFVPLGFAPIGDPVDVGGRSHQPVWLDFGEGSVDAWLRRLVGAEIDAQEAALAPGEGDGTGLSPREIEVLGLIADGLSNRAIGERLFISDKTVGRHVSNLFCKLGVHNRAQAARIATERRMTRAAGDAP